MAEQHGRAQVGWATNAARGLRMYTEDVKSSLFTAKGLNRLRFHFKENWKSGLTVALVNLPLSISLAVAANSTPAAGVVSAFWGGLVAALFGGSQQNIVGPTGALSGVLARQVILHGERATPWLAIYAGLISIIIFALQWERYVMLVPSSVTEGFTLGVAFIIALNQLNYALGLPKLAPKSSFVGNVIGNLSHVEHADPWSVATFAVTFVLLLALIKKWGRVPWVVIISALGIVMGVLMDHDLLGPIKLQTLYTRFGNLNLTFAQFPKTISGMFSEDFFGASFSVAFIAVLETLISAKIADQMAGTTFNQRREVFGLGFANVVSGMCGGIPVTAALARTALNVKSGGTHRSSAFINSACVLILGGALLRFFKYLPLPVVAATICVVSVRMVSFKKIVDMFHADRYAFALTLLVAVVCILRDPTSGIIVGIGVSLLIFSDHLSRGHAEVIVQRDNGRSSFVTGVEEVMLPLEQVSTSDANERGITIQRRNRVNATVDDEQGETAPLLPTHQHSPPHMGPSTIDEHHHADHHGHVTVYRLLGQLSYVNCFAHYERLKAMTEVESVILSMRYLQYLDVDGLECLEHINELLTSRGQRVLFAGVNPSLGPMLSRAPWFEEKTQRGEVYDDYQTALTACGGSGVNAGGAGAGHV